MTLGYIHDPNCVSPKMTAADAPSPNVVTVSGYSGSQYGWLVFKQLGNANPWWLNSTATPQWIQLDTGEGNSLTINAYSMTSNNNNQNYPGMPRTWLLEGSNNGTNWFTIDDFSSPLPDACESASTRRFLLSTSFTYRFFRFTFTLKDSGANGWQIDEIELINTPDAPFVHNASCVHDAMTAVDTPSPLVASAGGYSGVDLPWKAFNRYGIQMASFYWNYGPGTWLKLDLGSAKLVNKYTLTAARNNGSFPGMPKSWEIQGSNNDSAWTILDTRTNVGNWRAAAMRTYDIASPAAYRYYLFGMTAMEDNNSGCQVDEVEWIYDAAKSGPFPTHIQVAE
jgi:hypothetical protein